MIQHTRRYVLSLTALLLIVFGIGHPTLAVERTKNADKKI